MPPPLTWPKRTLRPRLQLQAQTAALSPSEQPFDRCGQKVGHPPNAHIAANIFVDALAYKDEVVFNWIAETLGSEPA